MRISDWRIWLSTTLNLRHQHGVTDAFISYSSHDHDIALSIQSGLQKLAKPWYRPHAVSVFRDATNLTAGQLWTSLKRVLDQTRFIVLIASEDAATSSWVAQELCYWLTDGRHQTPGAGWQEDIVSDRRSRLLLVLANGRIAWRSGSGDDFDWQATNALPRMLQGVFTEEPLWVDLSSNDRPKEMDLRDLDFLRAVAKLSVPIRCLDPREIDSQAKELMDEDRRQHRRTMQTARLTIVSLACLLAVAMVAGVTAYVQRNTAIREAIIAESHFLHSASGEMRTMSAILEIAQEASYLGDESSSTMDESTRHAYVTCRESMRSFLSRIQEFQSFANALRLERTYEESIPGLIGRVHRCLADLEFALGDTKAAERQYKIAITYLDHLFSRFQLPDLGIELSESYRGLARIHETRGAADAARMCYRKSLATSQRMLENFPDIARYREQITAAHPPMYEGVNPVLALILNEIEKSYDEIRQAPHRQIIETFDSLADLEIEDGNQELAADYRTKSLQQVNFLAREFPTRDNLVLHVNCTHALLTIYSMTNAEPASLAHLAREVDQRTEQLVRRHPKDVEVRKLRDESLSHLSTVLRNQGRFEEALETNLRRAELWHDNADQLYQIARDQLSIAAFIPLEDDGFMALDAFSFHRQAYIDALRIMLNDGSPAAAAQMSRLLSGETEYEDLARLGVECFAKQAVLNSLEPAREYMTRIDVESDDKMLRMQKALDDKDRHRLEFWAAYDAIDSVMGIYHKSYPGGFQVLGERVWEALKEEVTAPLAWAALTIGASGTEDPEHHLALIFGLQHEHADVRIASAIACGWLGEKARANETHLISLLEEPKQADDDLVEQAALYALSRIGPLEPSTLHRLGARLTYHYSDQVMYAIAQQRHAGLKTLVELINDASDGFGSNGVSGQRKYPRYAFTPFNDVDSAILFPYLQHSSVNVRRGVAYALKHCEGPLTKAVPELLNAIAAEEDESIKQNMIAALGRISDSSDEVITALTGLLADPQPRIRGAAMSTIGVLQPDVERLFHQIARLLHDDDLSNVTEGEAETSPAVSSGDFDPFAADSFDPFVEPETDAIEQTPEENNPTRLRRLATWQALLALNRVTRRRPDLARPLVVDLIQGIHGRAFGRLLKEDGTAVNGFLIELIAQLELDEPVVEAWLLKCLRGREAEVRLRASAALWVLNQSQEAYLVASREVVERGVRLEDFQAGSVAITISPSMTRLLRAIMKDKTAGEFAARELRRFCQRDKLAELCLECLNDPHPTVRRNAIVGLVRPWDWRNANTWVSSDSQRVYDLLLALLKDEDALVRIAAAEGVLHMRYQPQVVVPVLATAAMDSDLAIRERAVAAFGELRTGVAPATDALLSCLGTDSNELRVASLSVLDRIAQNSIDRRGEILAEALPLRNNSSVHVRRSVAKLLRRFTTQSEKVVPALIEMLGDEDHSVVSAASSSLARFGATAKAGLPRLLEQAASDEDRVRQSAILALGYVGRRSQEARSVVQDGLDDVSTRVRVAAAYSLWILDPTEVDASLAVLFRHLTESRAQLYVYRVGRPAVNGLIEVLDEKDVRKRELAIRILGWIGEAAAIAKPALENVILGDNRRLRSAAEQALQRIQRE